MASKVSDYEKYLEDMSLIGKEIACSQEEKECYKFDRVLQSDGKCYMLSHVGPCNNQELHFNKEKADKGAYVAECTPSYKCGSPSLRFMAYDETCYTASLVNDVCDHKKNLSFSQNFFGEGQCRCTGKQCPPRPQIVQPEESGRCRLPDLIKTSFPYLEDPLAFRSFPCSNQEGECFSQGKMLHSDGLCHSLLTRGPCSEGELLVANKTVFRERGWLLSACEKSSCEEGKVRMQHDKKCYALEDVKNKMCPPHLVVFDVFGEAGCGFQDDTDLGNSLPYVRNGKCYSRKQHH